MAKVRDFKVGDKVYSLHWGDGVVTNINPGAIYPVEVKWSDGNYDCFTAQGQCDCDMADSEIDIVPIDEVKKEPTFHVGDHVISRNFGKGVVTRIVDPKKADYPVEVHWIAMPPTSNYASEFYTLDGQFHAQYPDPEYDIIHDIDHKDAKKVLPDTIHELGDDEEEDNKKVEDAINPSHYKVDGLPEAIDIMNHLMTPDQFEGFLWGNIMKYAYRFGRKGDKGETAGKIAWYANQLKAVEDWMKENET